MAFWAKLKRIFDVDHVMTDKDFQAQMDMETLIRAKEIQEVPGRVSAAKRFAEEKAEEMREAAGKIESPKPRPFNGAKR